MGFISIVIVNNLVFTKFLGICPYLGVSGRIDMAFGMGMAVMGTGNARAMATGISMATIPTMAGLVVALSGLFCRVRLRQQARLEHQRAAASSQRTGDSRGQRRVRRCGAQRTGHHAQDVRFVPG